MSDLDLSAIEQRWLIYDDDDSDEPVLDAAMACAEDIPALVAEVKRLREKHRMLHRVECNHTSQPIGGPGCICVVANKYAEERIADNALEEAAKIARKCGNDDIAREIRALKTNKGE